MSSLEGAPVHLRLPPDFWSARIARRHVARVLDEVGWSYRADAAQLIVSELVTNAVEHAATDVEVRVEVSGEVLRLEVVDGGGGRPERRGTQPGDTGGRGLNVVDFLASSWGTTVEPGRTTVWCTLSP